MSETILGFPESPLLSGKPTVNEPEPDDEGDEPEPEPDAKPCGNSSVKTKTSVRVERLWHVDTMGNKNPDALVDKLFVHMATAHLYRITGCSFDATSDEWCLHYKREVTEHTPFSFTRTMSDFLTPGKFIAVK